MTQISRLPGSFLSLSCSVLSRTLASEDNLLSFSGTLFGDGVTFNASSRVWVSRVACVPDRNRNFPCHSSSSRIDGSLLCLAPPLLDSWSAGLSWSQQALYLWCCNLMLSQELPGSQSILTSRWHRCDVRCPCPRAQAGMYNRMPFVSAKSDNSGCPGASWKGLLRLCLGSTVHAKRKGQIPVNANLGKRDGENFMR